MFYVRRQTSRTQAQTSLVSLIRLPSSLKGNIQLYCLIEYSALQRFSCSLQCVSSCCTGWGRFEKIFWIGTGACCFEKYILDRHWGLFAKEEKNLERGKLRCLERSSHTKLDFPSPPGMVINHITPPHTITYNQIPIPHTHNKFK